MVDTLNNEYLSSLILIIIMPLVSVITPMFNASTFIESTIRSVLAQTYSDWEMIVVDDCSSDGSKDLVKNFLNDSRIKLLTHSENLGIAMARNTAIKFSTGKYIAFLDSDDIWLPTKLEKQLADSSLKNLGISFSSYFLIDEFGQRVGVRNPPNFVTYTKLLRKNVIGNLTGIYDTEKFGKVYLKNIRHEDYALWLELFKSTERPVAAITDPLAEYRVYATSVSSNKFKSALWTWNIYRNVEKLQLHKAFFYFSCYVFYSILDRFKRHFTFKYKN